MSNIWLRAVPGQNRENQDEEIVKEMAALPPKTSPELSFTLDWFSKMNRKISAPGFIKILESER